MSSLDHSPSQRLASGPKNIYYDDWRSRIQMATDIDQLVRTMREYLAAWEPAQLRQLPWDLSAAALLNSEDIISRAVIATREELKYSRGAEAQPVLLREMALSFSAAASRFRFLKSLGNRV